MILTEIPEEADVLLLNTCSIREKAQEKVFSALGRWRKIKKKRPGVIIGVGGCVASQEGAAIQTRAPFVDIVFGPQTLHRLPELLNQARSEQKAVVDVSFPRLKSLMPCQNPALRGQKHLCPLWRGAANIAVFVLCHTPVVKKSAVP